MEPVHHVALLVLVRAAAQQVDAHGLRVGVDERQTVLQLVAETVGAAALVKRAFCQKAACKRLIRHEAVEHQIQRQALRMQPHRRNQLRREGKRLLPLGLERARRAQHSGDAGAHAVSHAAPPRK